MADCSRILGGFGVKSFFGGRPKYVTFFYIASSVNGEDIPNPAL